MVSVGRECIQISLYIGLRPVTSGFTRDVCIGVRGDMSLVVDGFRCE